MSKLGAIQKRRGNDEVPRLSEISSKTERGVTRQDMPGGARVPAAVSAMSKGGVHTRSRSMLLARPSRSGNHGEGGEEGGDNDTFLEDSALHTRNIEVLPPYQHPRHVGDVASYFSEKVAVHIRHVRFLMGYMCVGCFARRTSKKRVLKRCKGKGHVCVLDTSNVGDDTGSSSEVYPEGSECSMDAQGANLVVYEESTLGPCCVASGKSSQGCCAKSGRPCKKKKSASYKQGVHSRVAGFVHV